MRTNFQSGSKDQSRLPRSVEEYFRTGAPEGERNVRLFDAATQVRDSGRTQSEAETLLNGRATADGLSESEIRTAIVSAYSRAPREPAASVAPIKGGYSPRPEAGASYRITSSVPSIGLLEDAQPEALPARIEGGFEALLLAAFEEKEGVAIGGTFPRSGAPDAGEVRTREEWIEMIRAEGIAGDFSKLRPAEGGHFIRINPMRVGPESKKDADVTAFRHVLVECDKDSEGSIIPKDRQLGAILTSGFPITAILDSGNKSIHAWVRVDAKDAEEYRTRAAEVFSVFGDWVDTSNKNPSRYSRCPDGHRTVSGELVKQALLMTHVGATSWDSWKREHDKTQALAAATSPHSAGVLEQLSDSFGPSIPSQAEPLKIEETPSLLAQFPVISSQNLQVEFPNPPEPVIEEIVGEGEKLILGGSSKAGKTYCLLNLAASVQSGEMWLGFQCRKGDVLFLNFEVSGPRMAERARHLKGAGVSLDGVDFLNLRGARFDWIELTAALEFLSRKKRYTLIIIDPIYKLLGQANENDNSAVAVILSEIERIAVETKAVTAFAHHFSKGNKSESASIDRLSGAGAFARDPDAILTLTDHAEDGCLTLESTVRNYAAPTPVVVEYAFPVYSLREDLDYSRLKTARRGGHNRKGGPETVVEALTTRGPMSSAELQRALVEITGADARTARRWMSDALKDGKHKKVVEVQGVYRLAEE
jgi:RecA-family ATPase